MRWDDVRYFLELARQGSLSAAARSLAVEHTTVARRVAALEKRIGIRLFDRLPKSWSLTQDGEQLLQHAYRIEEEALAFSRATAGASSLRGTVRLSAPPVFGSHFLVPRLAAVRRQWPGIAIDLAGESREANLYRREADLALRLSRPEAPGLAARPLAQIGYGLYGASGWIGRASQEWEFVGYNDSLRETPQQQWLEKVAGARPFVLRSNDLAALYQACRAGLGIAVLPHFLARDDPALVALAEYPCPVARQLWLVVHPDVRRSPRVKAVADALVTLFRESAAVLA
ncbi:LysR family transcriptional regulator [Noviherbaspirillum autotrophicum]|uniref:LysR family transcriptional regulator n=1 Tax=Noviherbaspirillum autotrophicum TaxID=709839 RepID=A0A0C2C0E5_9BURK|nr:LysR family transcriptional regulator [Noviherbaspirillum autotrophicum]KIF83771.1 LysR family transcriptional regulator [Noviherbaspirillum autotrophicum]